MVHRLAILVPIVGLVTWLSLGQTALAQQAGATGGAGGTTAGIGQTQTSGFSLSDRFSSNFNVYTGGSANAGSTTAGAGAANSTLMGQQGGFDIGSAFGRGGMSTLGGMTMMGGFGRNMNGGRTGQNQAGNTQNKIRTHLILGFSPTPRASTAATARVAMTLNRVAQRRDQGGGQVNVEMDGETVVLTGMVSSDHARILMERLARLEPGISDVRNELTVGLDEPKPESSPTPKPAG